MVREFSSTRFAYAAMLLRWGLYRQATEMIQLATRHDPQMASDSFQSDSVNDALVIGTCFL